MAQKLWEKSVQVDRDVERFTVGKDREMDLYLAPFDILGSLAHISMLQSIGLLTAEELKQLTEELRNIYRDTETGKFLIEEGVEDVHSQVELLLTRKLGDIGKKIHSGRSRNDQVLVDLKLFTRSRLQNIVKKTEKLFDLIARRFIAVFYPDCKFSTTTVTGEADSIEFKVSGKQILDPGWRVIFAKDTEEESKEGEEESVLPAFSKGESGPHQPQLNEKWTQPPRPYTEATLLRAMETAGKLVDNDELRDALKENGIGRPSTRAAIIETLFKRHYIRKERKNLIATPTGVELIQLIREELLKSAELTGIWEKKLREIERRNYDAATFLSELKQMVTDIVYTVLRDNSNRRVTVMPEEPKAPAAKPAAREKKTEKKTTARKKKDAPSPAPANSLPEGDAIVGQPCPLCGKGTILKGKTAYGCSEWKNGCTFRKPFDPAPESQA
jgi:DNA topoisomerase-3